MITLTWVVDDTARSPLRSEHGFAMWIETDGGHVLFDTGGSGEVLLHNLRALDLNPADLNAVVLSHAHDDHTGGLEALLSYLPAPIPVYAHPRLFEDRYTKESAGMVRRGPAIGRETLEDALDLHLDDQPVEVIDRVWTTGEIHHRPEPEGRSRHHFVFREGRPVPDPYADDLSIVLDVGEERGFVICGCCHAGLLNTLEKVQTRFFPYVVGLAGGVHLVNADSASRKQTLKRLRDMSSLQVLWLGHCSGESFMRDVEEAFDSSIVREGGAGYSIAISLE